MKVKCLKEMIDINRICFAIDKFRLEHYGDRPSYIVMNFETKAELSILNYPYFSLINNTEEKNTILCGIPVAISDNLKYGEIDIV